MSEPILQYCTVRDAVEHWHIECFFNDGTKEAAIQVEKDYPLLAQFICDVLNESLEPFRHLIPVERQNVNQDQS